MAEITFRLDNFEGPLDLLLHLISKNKVNIYDIPIAVILKQYMAVLDNAQAMDMDVAGDFIAMAAQLLLIKSKMLLPVYENEEEDPRAELVEMLLEYQRFKEVTDYFRQQTDLGRDIFTKEAEPLEKDVKLVYDYSPDALIHAARNMMARVQRKLPPPVTAFSGIVGTEKVPVGAKITAILKLFLRQTKLSFLGLFKGAKSKSEIVATFLAVLELSKTNRILIHEEGSDTVLELSDELYAQNKA